jgi:hypothetical protein
MSCESEQRMAPLSSSALGTIVPRHSPAEPSCKFGIVVCALWPVKPGLNLAQRMGCSERHANLIIAGKRKLNARALHALISTFFEE